MVLGDGEYERLRAERIARNNAFLQSLDLEKKMMRKDMDAAAAAQVRTPRKRAAQGGPVRRSGRQRRTRGQTRRGGDGAASASSSATASSSEAASSSEGPAARRPRAAPRRRRAVELPAAAANSTRSLDVDVARVTETHFGRAVWPSDGQVKRACIEFAAGRRNVSFNKMSGICEWRNCVFLFVNIAPGGRYENNFDVEAGTMSWFAQPRQTDETAVIRRIVASTPADPVLLWCRPPADVAKCYVFCGRLVYREHDAAARPMRFLFALEQPFDVVGVVERVNEEEEESEERGEAKASA